MTALHATARRETIPFVTSPIAPSLPIAPQLPPPMIAIPAAHGTTSTTRLPSTIEPMADRSGRYVLRRRDASTFFTSTGLAFALSGKWGVHVALAGGRDGALVAEDQQPGHANVYRGEQSAWSLGTPTFGRVAWEDVYPGIDMVAEPAPGGVAYRFVLSPGARVSDIVMRWQGATAVRSAEDGRGIDVRTDVGVLRVRGLRAFAVHGAQRTELPARHIVHDGDVSLAVDGWDGRDPLVIDPTIAWSSYLGGSGGDRAYDVRVTSGGRAWVVGTTDSTDFPTVGALDATRDATDAFVSLLETNGTLLFSTYLGGAGQDEALAVAVDGGGNAVVTGDSFSTDFPMYAPSYDTSRGGTVDAFVARILSSGALQWSTYLGGSLGDFGQGIAVDGSWNVFVTGTTNSTDFPTAGGFDTTRSSIPASFVTKFSVGGALQWSTYLDGNGGAEARAIATDSAGNAFVTGYTSSPEFPTTGGFDTTLEGTSDAFITKISGAGALLWSSFLGGPGPDEAYGLATDGSGNAIVIGRTSSAAFPTTPGLDGTADGGYDAFVTKVGSSGTMVWSTYLGRSGQDEAEAVAVDGTSGDVFVVGHTDSTDFATSGAFDTTHGGGGSDAFVTRLSSTGALRWSSLLGGSGADLAYGVGVDATGNAVVVGITSSSDFPTTSGLDTTVGGTDAFVTRLVFSANGGACAIAAECRSSFCVDAVCCNTACTGTCQACTATKKGGGADGTCDMIGDGRDPDGECTAQSCVASVVTKASVCNGSGACRSDGTISCGLYACAGSACRTACSVDADCVATAYCNGTSCVADKALGVVCGAGHECASGFCVDGVCCDAACAGSCEACTVAKKGSGADGTCGFVGDGADPDSECTPQSCTAGVVTKAQRCNGAGACRTDGTIACGLYTCAGNACTTTCATDADCAAAAHCVGSACFADRDLGATCTEGRECKSGFCADGVCCDKACDGACEACTAAKKGSGTDGTCANVLADTDPRERCTADTTPGSCAADGMCDGMGACRTYAKKGVACGTTTCASGSVSGRTCNGAGTCETATTPCAPYACGTTACKTSCTTDADCSADGYCTAAKTCATKQAPGAACADARECAKGFCVDGVCCESGCTGQCEACNESGKAGTCVPVEGAPRGSRTACAGDPSVCGGTCDGTNPSACKLAPSTKSCGGSCKDGRLTPSTCDGLGACVAGSVRDCSPYLCADDKTCSSACTTDAQCAAGFRCMGGACLPAGKASKCNAARTAVESPDGKIAQCAPYICDSVSDTCKALCSSTADCQSGFDCTSNNVCAAPAVASDDGGCGCETGPRSAPRTFGGFSLALALALTVAARRRR